MSNRTPVRNRLAKELPREWRQVLVDRGVPKGKYTAVVRVTLTGGRVIDDLIVESGWIIALSKKGLAGTFEERIDFDPRQITAFEIRQVA
jgi:hypothetical protein